MVQHTQTPRNPGHGAGRAGRGAGSRALRLSRGNSEQIGAAAVPAPGNLESPRDRAVPLRGVRPGDARARTGVEPRPPASARVHPRPPTSAAALSVAAKRQKQPSVRGAPGKQSNETLCGILFGLKKKDGSDPRRTRGHAVIPLSTAGPALCGSLVRGPRGDENGGAGRTHEAQWG